MEAKKRVLIVEDWEAARKSLRWVLEMWGYVVQDAGDGLLGVQEALAWQPDAVIVDIGLPGLDGFEVARQVREGLQGNVLLIALTAYEEPDYIRRAIAAGFDSYLVKPADLIKLKRMLVNNTRDLHEQPA
jgi:CheY-like chemotaxis protein